MRDCGQEGCQGIEASKQRGQGVQRLGIQAHEPVHSGEPAFLLFPLHFLSSAVQSTDVVGGISETPVIHRSLLQLSPPPSSFPKPKEETRAKGWRARSKALGLLLGLIYPTRE